MKYQMIFSAISIIVLGLAACSPMLETAPLQPGPSSVVPKTLPSSSPTQERAMTLPSETLPTGTPVIHGNVYIESYRIVAGGQKNSIFVYITGNLPTPCHQIQVEVKPPDEQKRLYIEVYSSAKSGGMCVQVLSPFEYKAEVTHLADGDYSLYINGKKEDDFQIPFQGA